MGAEKTGNWPKLTKSQNPHWSPDDAQIYLLRPSRSSEGASCVPSRDAELILVLAYYFGAGLLLFQMSRCSFHCPASCFQITTYLPTSITCPPSPSRVYFPTSPAVSP